MTKEINYDDETLDYFFGEILKSLEEEGFNKITLERVWDDESVKDMIRKPILDQLIFAKLESTLIEFLDTQIVKNRLDYGNYGFRKDLSVVIGKDQSVIVYVGTKEAEETKKKTRAFFVCQNYPEEGSIPIPSVDQIPPEI